MVRSARKTDRTKEGKVGVAKPRDFPLRKSRMADAGIGASLRGNKMTQKELISSGAGLRKLSTRIKQGIRKAFDKKDKKSE